MRPRRGGLHNAAPTDTTGFDHSAAFGAYGEFSGILVGFVVAALAVVFSIAPDSPTHTDTLDRVVLQLSLGLLSGAVSALTFTTLAAYATTGALREVPHLLLLAPAVCAITVLAAFEELAVTYLPTISGYLVLVTTCMAGLSVVPGFLMLPWRWAHRLLVLAFTWVVLLVLLLLKEYAHIWTPSNGLVAALAIVVAVVVSASSALAYVRVGHAGIAERFLRWDTSDERFVASTLMAVISWALVTALLTPPGH